MHGRLKQANIRRHVFLKTLKKTHRHAAKKNPLFAPVRASPVGRRAFGFTSLNL